MTPEGLARKTGQVHQRRWNVVSVKRRNSFTSLMKTLRRRNLTRVCEERLTMELLNILFSILVSCLHYLRKAKQRFFVKNAFVSTRFLPREKKLIRVESTQENNKLLRIYHHSSHHFLKRRFHSADHFISQLNAVPFQSHLLFTPFGEKIFSLHFTSLRTRMKEILFLLFKSQDD